MTNLYLQTETSPHQMHNLYQQNFVITRRDREQLAGHSGCVVWFTGLSGAGKSTVSNALEVELFKRGRRTYILDGDNVRQGLNKDLPFTDAGREENIRRVAEVARLMMDAGLIVLTAFISPFQRDREMARALIGSDRFVEVFINTSLAICESRDPKGLYKKARRGQLHHMTGIDSAYEPPLQPTIEIDGGTLLVEDSVKKIIPHIEELISGERPYKPISPKTIPPK